MAARLTPTSAKTSPSSAPVSSSSTTGSSGALARRTNCTQFAVPRTSFDSRTAVRSENASSTIATSRMATATPGEVSGSCSCSLWNPSYRENSEPRANRTRATTNA
jgi:hypothetical protein